MPSAPSLASTANNKVVAINIVLVTNAFVWYYFIIIMLQTILKNTNIAQSISLLVWAIHFGGLIVSAIIGATLSKKISNITRFISVWMAFGIILSVISIFTDPTSIPPILILSLLFGFALGIGMPSCMGYFTANVTVEKRGRVGGIIFLLTCLIIVALGIVVGDNIGLQTVILSGWRIFGLVIFLAFLALHPVKGNFEKSQASNQGFNYRSLVTQRSFLLYLIPWLLFSLIAYLTLPLQMNIIQTMQVKGITIPSVESLRGFENIIGAISAVIGGFLIDRVGRKRVSIIGFAMLGLSYSLLGIFPENPVSWYFYTVVDGIAWGVLFVIFVVTIWADLSNGVNSEKYYAVGVLPFFISYFLKLTAQNNIAATFSSEAIFSLTAFLLFLAVLPLLYAPETLPEKHMKERELKNYIEKANKIAKKEEERKQKQQENSDKNATVTQEEENSKEYEHVKQLAEKYY